MAWTTPVSVGGWNNTANQATYASTATIAFTANRLYIVVLYMRCGAGDVISAMTLTGSTGSWTFGAEQLDSSGNNDRLGYFWKVATTTETVTLTVTSNQGSQSNCLGECFEMAAGEFNSSTPIKQADFATTASAQTSLAVTLSPSPDSDSLSVAAFGYRSNSNITPDGTFTELNERALGGAGSDAGAIETEYDTTTPAATCTATGASAFWVGVHFEIDAAAAGGGPVRKAGRRSLLGVGHGAPR